MTFCVNGKETTARTPMIDFTPSARTPFYPGPGKPLIIISRYNIIFRSIVVFIVIDKSDSLSNIPSQNKMPF